MLREKLLTINAATEQVIDETSPDHLIEAGFTRGGVDRGRQTVKDLRAFLHEHRDELAAVEAMYAVPYKRRLTYKDIKELANAIKRPPRAWTPDLLWDAYATVETSRVHGGGRRIATDLVSLVRFALEQDNELVPYQESVEQRF